MPFPDYRNTASAKLIKEYNRPEHDIPSFSGKVLDATSDIYAQQSVLTLSVIQELDNSKKRTFDARDNRTAKATAFDGLS